MVVDSDFALKESVDISAYSYQELQRLAQIPIPFYQVLWPLLQSLQQYQGGFR